MRNSFIAPKHVIDGSKPMFNDIKRIPRKFKKKHKYVFSANRYDFLTMEQKMWFILGRTNPQYKLFLINTIIHA